MAWSGGTYTKGNNATGGWTGDAAAGIGIEAGRHDTQDTDFATGINQCLNKDGSNAATGNLNIGSFKLTAVANGTARTDAAAMGQLQDGGAKWGGTSSGSANAQTLTLSPAITAYAAGQRFSFLAGFTNTAATTLNVNSVGAKNIFNAATGAAIGASEIVSGRAYEVLYDGTQFLLLNDVTPIQNSEYIWLGTTGGTATAQTASATPALTAYKAGQKFRMIVGSGLSSTGTAANGHSININSLGAKQIVNRDGTNSSPSAGSWIAGALLELLYDGTYFRITNDPGGWQTFAATISGSGSMTVSGQTNKVGDYIKIGSQVTIVIDSTFTLGGTAAQSINIAAPVDSPYYSSSTGVAFGIPFVTTGGASNIGQAYFTTANNIAMYRDPTGAPANWVLGSNTIRFMWTYRGV